MSEKNQSLEEILFELAVQKPSPAEREAFLDVACRDLPALRAQLFELLEIHFGAAGFLPNPVTPAPPPAAAPSTHAGASAPMVGRYKLLEKIGEGGMGEVWMAGQTEPVKRQVALKIIKLGMDCRQIVARFEAERQALAMMDHPNIAKIFDAGATEQGRPYFVMELVMGSRITDYCNQKQLSIRQRLDLFVEICHAVQHAHQKGIIHRDLKPSNILVVLQDGLPVPKVIDFGIAKATEGRLTEATVSTQLHQILGTPAYMSPEQVGMTVTGIDTRSDVYSLGVLLYELLTGHTPFDAQELAKEGIEAIRRTIREVEPPRPSTRLSTLHGEALTVTARNHGTEGAHLLKSIRGDLDWIVMKCLEKDRSRRYETANGLAMDLTRFLANEMVSARPPSASYRLQKALRRHKSAFSAAALIAVLLVAATGISTWQALLARQRLAESKAISKFLTQVFQSPDPSRDGRTITVAETLGAAEKKLEKDLASQPALRAKLLATIGLTYFGLGLYREAIPLQEKVRDYYLVASGKEHPATLGAMSDLANSYAASGRTEEALKLSQEVLVSRREVLGPEHPDTLRAMHDLACSFFDVGRRSEALALQEQVLTLSRKVKGPEHSDTLDAMNNLANSYETAGRRDEALKLQEELLPLSRKVKGTEHPDTLRAMHNLARSYIEAGRAAEAFKLREQVLDLRRKVLGPKHPGTLGTMLEFANSYDEAGRREEALKLREQVVALRREILGLENADTLSAMNNLANSYGYAGRQEEALELREQVLALRRKVLGPEHPDTVWAMHNLVNSYRYAGRREEALELREEILPLLRKIKGTEAPETLGAMIDLAYSYRDAGRTEEAIKLGESSLGLFRRVSGPNHENTLNAMTELATSYRAAHRTREATSLEEESLRLKREHLPVAHPGILESMENLADCYEESGRLADAEALRRELAGLKLKAANQGPNTNQSVVAPAKL